MKKSISFGFLLAILPILTLLSCKDDSYLLTPPPVPDQSFVEEFDTAQSAYNRGWRFVNRSVLVGRRSWANPIPDANADIPFQAYSGANGAAYLWTDYLSTASASGIISNWVVSPEVILQNGDKIVFYTRAQLYDASGDSVDFVNRMQVRLSKTTTLNCGDGIDPGFFSDLLLDINPSYYPFSKNAYSNPSSPLFNQSRQAFPHVWTRFEATVAGLDGPTKGKFAFRYFIEDAGSNGRGSSIGIDNVTYIGKH